MELHTLGVDGGYTQKDVTEVARCFTGWTIRGLRGRRPARSPSTRASTTAATRSVLGQRIKGGGQDEGEQVLHLLATHPSTARFISHKLARRFVADEPPAALVDRAAETFRRTDGDIRAVVTHDRDLARVPRPRPRARRRSRRRSSSWSARCAPRAPR